MTQRKRKQKTSQAKHGGGGKVRLTRLELFLMGKGPAASAQRQMYRDSAKGAKR